ncbi:glypican-6 [Cylas formicarius]|uniref:glypican-6 n=1 Tax=Cylas formicarius TaxID=197179 RepID=UPI002958DA2E|nr:glypican-6 [Cylas formicarius]XP_060533314.1 glypican-6 [Cylas formicarius]
MVKIVAVMYRTEKMCCIQILLVLTVARFSAGLPSPPNCESIKRDIEVRWFSGLEFVESSDTGSICGENSCCRGNLEDNMLEYSRSFIEKYISDSALKVASLIEARAKKFDEIFREMMNNSKREFHDMFQKTYGKIYLQNSEVFSDFFNELETYYKKGTLHLGDTMDSFFAILYQRMFAVINAQYSFDDKYLECVADLMVEIKPFGDVPYKLSQQLRRSFVATRTFYKALTRGVEVSKAMAKLPVDEECVRALTRMQFCGACKGEQGAGACSDYCIGTVKICLRHHVQLNEEWDKYIDAIEKVAERLLGPYNVESVVLPLNIKISEAVMNFQENGSQVSKKVYSKCGVPSTRATRSAYYETSSDGDMEIDSGAPKKKHKKTQEEDDSPALDKLLTEIKSKVKDTKQFWLQLPYQYCNNQNVSASPSDDGQCWNGTTIGTYDHQQYNDSPTPSPIIGEQIYVLQGISEKLRKAHQGMEVEIVDDTEESFTGSGSGSGDGYDDDDEDVREENYDKDVSGVDVQRGYHPSKPSTSTPSPEVVRAQSGAPNVGLSVSLIAACWLWVAVKDLL